MTIATSTVISAFNSLTLSPALAALILKPHGAKRDPLDWLLDVALGWFFGLFNRAFGIGTSLYVGVVAQLLRVTAVVLLIYGGLLGLTWFEFKHVPTGFVPEQDKGYLLLNVQLPDSASVERTQEAMRQIETIARDLPGVEATVGISGQSLLLAANAPNLGSMYVMLKEFSQRRGISADDVAAELRTKANAQVRDALLSVFGAPPIDGLGTTGGFKLIVEDRGNLGLDTLQKVSDQIVAEGNRTPGLTGLFNSLRANTPWLYLDIDRTKCLAVGLSIQSVFDTLQIYLGSYYVNNFNEFGRSWQVNVMADPRFRARIEDLKLLKVRNNRGEMVPLATVLDVRDTSGPVAVMRYNMYSATAINGNMAPGTSSGQAITLVQDIAHKVLPPSMAYDWTELTYMQLQAGNTAVFRLRPGGGVRLFGAGRAVRKLEAADGRDPGRADVPALLGRRRRLGPAGRQYLHADRLGGSGRAGQQERDSDRRVRQAAARSRRGAPRGRDRSLPPAAAADPDDLVRLHPGRGAAGGGRGAVPKCAARWAWPCSAACSASRCSASS